MKTMLLCLIGAALLLVTAASNAYADSLFVGEQLGISGTAIVTSGTHVGQTGPFIGSFTLGSMIGGALWNVTAFSAANPECTPPHCTETWAFTLTFDASDGTLVGNASSLFTGGGGDSREWIQTFVDGNTTTNPFSNLDLTHPLNNRAGTTMYAVAATPEPTSLSLLASGLLCLAGAIRRKRFPSFFHLNRPI